MFVVVPRPPHRSHSLGSSSSVVNSTLGGVINKHVGMERLRHSISVARGHHTSNNSNNGNSNSLSSSSGNNSRAGSQASTPTAFQGDSFTQAKSIGSGGAKIALVRRNSGHSSGSSGVSVGAGGGSGTGWTGANQAPSYKFSVTPAGSVARGDEAGARQRGVRPAQQVF